MAINLKKRKIQQIGYSFLVSIPPLWLDNCNLKKGDFVTCKIDWENRLILEAVKNEEVTQ